MIKGQLAVIGLVFSMNATALPDYIVTNGTVDTVFSIESPTSRIDFPQIPGDRFRVKATYLGPTKEKAPFASGEIVEQLGIKVRSINECNLVYVMRVYRPTSRLIISYKENVGMMYHSQCLDKGYVSVKSIYLPMVGVGSTIDISTKFYDTTLIVYIDNILVWSGNIPLKGLGTAGLRTDNVKTIFRVVQ